MIYIFRKLFISSILLVLCASHSLAQEAKTVSPPRITEYQGKIVSVIDGDTLRLRVEDKTWLVRLLGIDVPLQALSDSSRKNLSGLVEGKMVRFLAVPLELKVGGQTFKVGRVLLDGQDAGLAQISSGLAWQSDEFEKYQSREDQQSYAQAEQDAKNSKRGIWGASFKPCKGAPPAQTLAGNPAGTNSGGSGKPKVSGTVIVEVTINEPGNVISAHALCGHPILQTAAVKAAFQSTFRPAATRITGTLVYNFVVE